MPLLPLLSSPLATRPQAPTPHKGYVSATYTCRCHPDNPPDLIRGTDMAAVCPRCQAIYAITAVSFDRTAGDTEPRVRITYLGQVGDDIAGGPVAPGRVS